MKQLKRLLSVLLVFVMAFTFAPVKINAASENSVKYYFIDVTGSCGKGDATLIRYNDHGTLHFVLVDCGPEKDYSTLKNALSSCIPQTNGKIVLDAVIITHDHTDHAGALKNLCHDTGKINKDNIAVVVKNVYCSQIDKNTIANKIETEKTNIPQTIVSTGKTIELGECTGITIFGSAKKSNNANQDSMTVEVVGKTTALIFGDQTYDGLNATIKKYKNKFSESSYDVCKFGHHGLRTKEETSDLNDECNLYNKYIKAKYYIMTTTRDKIESKSALDNNYKTIKKTLKNYKYIGRSDCTVDGHGITSRKLYEPGKEVYSNFGGFACNDNEKK